MCKNDKIKIDRLKGADKSNLHEEVVAILGELLDESFDRSVKLAVEGARKFLTGGVLTGKRSKHFWESDLPLRFGVNFATSTLYRKDFWRGFYRAEAPRVDVLELLKGGHDDSIEGGVRQNLVFRDSVKWSQVKSFLKPAFIQQCELMDARLADAEMAVLLHKDLLKKVCRETLVVHFAVWLEKQYLRSDNEQAFECELDQNFEVLEMALRLSHEHAGKQEAKGIGEINREIEKLFKRALKSQAIELDTFKLFDAVDELLWAQYDLELFSRQDWHVESGDSFRLIPPSEEIGQAWGLASQKFHISDCFELIPWSEEDHNYFEKCRRAAPNLVTFNSDTEFYCSYRHLLTYLGEEVIEEAQNNLGFDPVNALQLLRSNKDCYKSQYVIPRAKVKAAGGTLEQVLATNPRFCVESRDLNSFVQIAQNYQGTSSIPPNETREIYRYFSRNIHEDNVSLEGKLLLDSGASLMLLTRYFSGDLKTYLFNVLFKDFHKKFSMKFEDQVAHNFEGAGFNTIVRKEIPNGEIDVFAYKDGVLFLVEAKVTYARTRTGQVADVYDRLSSGSDQLHRAMSNFSEIWDDIRGELGASEELKDLRIIPLLVHNSFEYDHCYFDGILKVTEFELRMLFADAPDMTYRLSLQHRELFLGEEFSEDKLKEEFQAHERDGFKSMRLLKMEDPEVDDWISAIEDSRFWCMVFGRKLPLTEITPIQIV